MSQFLRNRIQDTSAASWIRNLGPPRRQRSVGVHVFPKPDPTQGLFTRIKMDTPQAEKKRQKNKDKDEEKKKKKEEELRKKGEQEGE